MAQTARDDRSARIRKLVTSHRIRSHQQLQDLLASSGQALERRNAHAGSSRCAVEQQVHEAKQAVSGDASQVPVPGAA